MRYALKIIFLFTLSTILINCSSKNTPYVPISYASYAEVNSEYGCGSWKSSTYVPIEYANYWMTWPGEVTAVNGISAYLDLDGKSMPDLEVMFSHNHAGDKLSKGDVILVRFKLKEIGGCISPYVGYDATIKPRLLSKIWWKFYLSKW